MIKVKKEIVKKQIKHSLISAEQVIKETPEKELYQMGGFQELLKNTKNNIVDSLAYYGFIDESKDISKIDVKSFSNLRQFESDICRLADVC